MQDFAQAPVLLHAGAGVRKADQRAAWPRCIPSVGTARQGGSWAADLWAPGPFHHVAVGHVRTQCGSLWASGAADRRRCTAQGPALGDLGTLGQGRPKCSSSFTGPPLPHPRCLQSAIAPMPHAPYLRGQICRTLASPALRTRECSDQSSALGVSRSAQALRCTLCTCRAPAQSPGSLRSEQLVLRVRDRGVDQQAAHAPLGRRQVLQLQPRSSHRVCRGSRRPSVLWLADRQTVGPFSGTQVDSGPFSGTQVDRGWLSPAVRAARSRSL